MDFCEQIEKEIEKANQYALIHGFVLVKILLPIKIFEALKTQTPLLLADSHNLEKTTITAAKHQYTGIPVKVEKNLQRIQYIFECAMPLEIPD